MAYGQKAPSSAPFKGEPSYKFSPLILLLGI